MRNRVAFYFLFFLFNRKARSYLGVEVQLPKQRGSIRKNIFNSLPIVLNMHETQNAETCPRYKALLYKRVSLM